MLCAPAQQAPPAECNMKPDMQERCTPGDKFMGKEQGGPG